MEPTYTAPSNPSGAELPPPIEAAPVAREIPKAPQVEAAPIQTAEKGAAVQEKKTPTLDRKPAAQPAQQLPDDNASQQPAVVQDTSSSIQQVAQDDTPAVAGDVDLLEKEWVSKAKQVVEDHREDPYVQEKEVIKLQASYLKKRYGKDLKIPQD